MTTPSLSSRIPELDGIRGLAIVGVLAFHLLAKPLLESQEPLSVALTLVAWTGSIGWLGVDLFFVLSGYLITKLLIEEPRTIRVIRGFWFRRILRLLPLYYIVVILYFSLGRFLYPGGDAGASSLFRGQGWVWAHAVNIGAGLAGTWDSVPVPLAHLWSLSLEEQFYFVWPLVALGVSVHRVRVVAIWLIFTVPLLRWIALSLDVSALTIYVSLPTRVDALAMGALLAVIHRSKRKFHLWIPAIAAGVLASVLVLAGPGFRSPLMQALGFSAAAILFAGMVDMGVRGPELVRCLFQARALRWLGVRSYAIYLVHPLIGMTLDYIVRGVLAPIPIVVFGSGLIAAGLSCVAGGISWRWLEMPILRLRDRLSPRFTANLVP